ncbi:MAG TPA: MlaD family protein [Puia sp.]|jgi:phospholipid/cholesterol/gamma-HCH transport system substrate-binding protein|nr:MlaD family protein [Puia sp.]
MEKTNIKNFKLGILVLAGLVLMISTLYVIGRNENIFGSHFVLRSRFRNANGLIPGDNVRFAGLQAGTVKTVRVIDDTTIEATLLIDEEMKPFIHRNALASIGTEGLIGNKVIDITPVAGRASQVQQGDRLPSQQVVSTEDMLRTLDKAGTNIVAITQGLKFTVERINNSDAFWNILSDRRIALDVRSSLDNIRQASNNANAMTAQLRGLAEDITTGKGSVGRLLKDTAFATALEAAVAKISSAGDQLNSAAARIGNLAGNANTLVTDSTLSANLSASMENIRKGTAAFNENMEALKHNFLFRGYFKKQEKEAQKRANQKLAGN